MNTPFSAVLLLVLLAGGWLLGRRRTRPFLRSTDTSAVAALNRVQIERLQPSVHPSAVAPLLPGAAAWAQSGLTSSFDGMSGTAAISPGLPVQAGERQRRLRQLQAWMACGSREQRLQALAIARQASRRDGLPLLRLGLRDPDPLVMAAAAAGMVRFRGRSAAEPSLLAEGNSRRARPQPGNAATSRPRSVLRTR